MTSGPKPPLALLAELTHRCPLRCPYCSNPVDLSRRSTEMDTADWKRVFDQAVDLGVLQVHFSGGEPTARDDLRELVAHAEKIGLYSNLITSGVLLDKPQLEALMSAGLQHVQLSFQDSTAQSADHIGGFSGGHEKKRKVANWVNELGMPLTVNAVIHRGNIDTVESMIELAVALKAQRLEVANIQYYGWGLHNRAALLPTRAQLMAATGKVEAARQRLKGVLVIDYVVPDYYARRPKACMGGWAQSFININPEGKVMPCHAAESIPGLVFDNVQVRPLAEIWRNNTAFNRFRGTEWMPEPCRSCDQREKDWGGCRCQAMALLGDAAKTDPACEKSPDHYLMNEVVVEDAGSILGEFTYRQMGAPGGSSHMPPVKKS